MPADNVTTVDNRGPLCAQPTVHEPHIERRRYIVARRASARAASYTTSYRSSRPSDVALARVVPPEARRPMREERASAFVSAAEASTDAAAAVSVSVGVSDSNSNGNSNSVVLLRRSLKCPLDSGAKRAATPSCASP